MAVVSLAAARRAIDDHRYRKDAAIALGVQPHWIYDNFPNCRRGAPLCDSLIAAMHRLGCPLDRVAVYAGVSQQRVIRIVRDAEAAEIARLKFVGESVAWRTYYSSVAARRAGA